MEKIYMIAGGVSAVGLVGLLYARSRRAASRQQESAPASQDISGMLYSPPSISGGLSSIGGGAYSDGSSTGPGAQMQAPDLSSLLSKMFDSKTEQAKQQAKADTQANDANALSSLKLNSGDTAVLSHTESGTSIKVTNSVDENNKSLIESIYQSTLHRAADPAGMAFFTSQLKNGVSASAIVDAITNSAEAKGQK